MKWFMNLKISSKFLAFVLFAIINIIGIGLAGLHFSNTMAENTNAVYETNLLPIKWLGRAIEDANSNKALLLQTMLETDLQTCNEYKGKIKQNSADLNKMITQYEKLKLSEEEQQYLQKYKDNVTAYRSARIKMLDLAMQNRNAEAFKVYTENEHLYINLVDALRSLIDYNSNVADQVKKQNQKNKTDATFIVMACIAVSLAISLAFGIWMSSMLKRRFANLVKLASRVADGDLTANASIEATDEIGLTGTTLNNMAAKLRGLMLEINETSVQIATASEEVNLATEQSSQGSQHVTNSVSQLAGGTQQIAKNITELATGVQQIAKSVDQLSKGSQKQAEHVNDGLSNIKNINGAILNISHSVTETAKASEKVETAVNEGQSETVNAVSKVNQVKTTATGISQTINELGKLGANIEVIVELIKTIAGQTNLLALNAAIEAARAGEHGKGFAVVADEVKKLANESAEATEKITEMIKEIQNKTRLAVSIMDEGVKEIEVSVESIDKVNSALNYIQDAAKVSSSQVKSITAEVTTLAKDSEQVAQMMEEISSITQEIAASSEEISSITEQTAASAEEVSSITEESAASAEEISGVVEEQTASLEEINASSQSLAKIAEGLNKQISIFKI